MLYCNVQLWKYAIWYNKLLTKFSTWSLTVPVLGLRIVNISANATGRSGPFLIWVLVLTASESLLHRQSLSSSIVVFCCHYHILPSWPRWDACCLGTPAPLTITRHAHAHTHNVPIACMHAGRWVPRPGLCAHELLLLNIPTCTGSWICHTH
jgi:hypothetical protein